MRILTLGSLLLTVSCDPGADFRLVGGNGTIVSWAVADDSVRATVDASAFTIALSVGAVFDAPADIALALDSASLLIRDVEGTPLQIMYFTGSCDDSTPPAPLPSKRCVSGRVRVHSSNYSQLDSITVRFGYAIKRNDRVPLIARFARVR